MLAAAYLSGCTRPLRLSAIPALSRRLRCHPFGSVAMKVRVSGTASHSRGAAAKPESRGEPQTASPVTANLPLREPSPVTGGRKNSAVLTVLASPWSNGIKLSRYGHQPENDPGQRRQPGGLAGLPGLVPAAGPLGLALVAAAGPPGHEVAGECDLEGQVGGEVVKAVRGKSIRSR